MNDQNESKILVCAISLVFTIAVMAGVFYLVNQHAPSPPTQSYQIVVTKQAEKSGPKIMKSWKYKSSTEFSYTEREQ